MGGEFDIKIVRVCDQLALLSIGQRLPVVMVAAGHLPSRPQVFFNEFKWTIILETLAQGFILAVTLCVISSPVLLPILTLVKSFGWYLCTFHVGSVCLLFLHR